MAKVDIDPDVSQSTLALDIGKAYHQVLEDTDHKKENFQLEILNNACRDNNIGDPATMAMIRAMLYKYMILHEKSGLEIVCIEEEIEDKLVIGYIDVVLKCPNSGKWYICDMKTAAGVYVDQLSQKLPRDNQLNLYSYYIDQLAEKYNLDVGLYQGALYRVTNKTKIKFSKRETIQDYYLRCLDRIEAFQFFIPVDKLKPKKAYDNVINIRDKALELFTKKEEDIPQNFNSCQEWNRSCEYYSNCYPTIASEAIDGLEIFDSTDINSMVEPPDEFDFL